MNDELDTRLKGIIADVIRRAEDYRHNNDMSILSSGDLNDWFLPEAIAQIEQAYQEEQHTTALIWYTRLTNDLINDDDLKRTEHVGRILEYARIAAGLTKEDVKIELPDEYILHDPEFVAEHISPVVEIAKGDAAFMYAPSHRPARSPDITVDDFLTRFQTELDAEKPYMSPGEYRHALAAAQRATT